MKAALFKYGLWVLPLLHAGILFGGVDPVQTVTMSGKSFISGSGILPVQKSLVNSHSDFNATTYSFPANQQVRKIENTLQLFLNPDAVTHISFPYALEVEVEIKKFELGATAPKVNKVALKINYNPKEQTEWIEKANYHFVNCGRVEHRVLNVTLTDGKPLSPTNLSPAQRQLVSTVVGLRSEMTVERYLTFNFQATPNLLPPNLLTAGNELEIKWQPMPGAEYYDLEWAYVDDYDRGANNQVIKIPSAQLELDKHFNLARNSTRVRVTETQYTLPLVFESGYILYRVRGIGMDYDPTKDILYPMTGRWTTDQAPTVAAWPHKFTIAAPFEQDKFNWQIVASYAEEGKSKRVISFMDGTYRARQTITGLSTEQEAMAAEQIYDHQGRPAIQVLPVPTNDPTLKYYKHFNLKAPGQPYNRNHFDITKYSLSGPCEISADPMHTASGASNYYSPANPKKTGHNAYIPDAAGYPFIQTEYTPDNTGRVRRQSGVGPHHKLGSNHETVYYYGTPVQEELSMLFGVEVGDANHYKKNVVQDPNDQLSVSFLDLKGKVIATALAGNPPKNVDALDSYKPYQMDIDLMVFNQADSMANELVASRSFTVTTRSDYVFNYSASRPAFEAALCKGAKLCYDCVYDFEIKIIDNYSCNTVKYHEIKQINLLQFNADGGIAVNDACPKNPTSYNHSFTLNDLPVGSYTVTKTLKVNPAATEAYVQHYIDRFKKECGDVYDKILQSHLSKVDSSACDLADDEEPLNRCQIARQGMLGDVSPGGQYAHVDWATYSSNDPLSVFNDQNRLPEASAHWKNSSLVYKNEDGSNFQFKDAAGNPASHTALNLETFLEQWQPSFANALLPFHPEYCYLQWCEQDMPSFDFDVELALIATYNEAKTKGYFDIANPKLLRAKDPYFTGTGGGTTGSPTWVSLMDQAINVYYQNAAQNITAHSMLQVAVRTALQSANLPHALGDANNWIANPTASLQDSVWRHFRALYLAKKEEFQYRSRTFYAVNTCSNKGGYNGCIGAENFNWFSTGAGSVAFSGPFNSNTSPATACHWTTYHLYQNKAKRFPSIYDVPFDFDPYGDPNTVLPQFAAWAGGMTGEYCDTCTCNKALTQFVNWIIDTKPYLAGSPQNTPLPTLPFTADLLKVFGNCNIPSVTHFKAALQTNSNNLDVQLISGTAIIGWIYLRIPAGSPVNWRNADSLSCIKYIGIDSSFHTGGATLFNSSKQAQPIKLRFRPDCRIEQCTDPGLACPTTSEAKYLATLFNSLISQKMLDKALTLNSNYLSPGFAAYFNTLPNVQSPVTWNGKVVGNTLDATLSSSQVNCRFTLDLPPGLPLVGLGPVLAFKPDHNQTDPATGYTYHAVMQVALLNGNGTVSIGVKSHCFPLSYCGKCPPGQTRPGLAPATQVPDNKGRKPGGKPVTVNPVPDPPGNLNVVAAHDPTKPCYPCDTLDYTLTYDSLTLPGGLNAREQSIMVYKKPPADLCDPCVWPDSLPTIPMPNPCLEYQILAAYANAQYEWQQYLDSLTAGIRNGYVRHCMAAAETFTAKYTDDLHHFTLYYYDQAGNLLKTVPPEGVKPLSPAATSVAIDYMRRKVKTPVNPKHEMASDYTYNSLNQLRKQTIPDHDGPSEFFYDYLSRIVVSQNPEQKLHKRYSYTLYDPLNRPYETGEILNATSLMTPALAKNETQLKNWVAAQTKREVTRTQYDKPLPGIAAQFFNGDERHYRDRIASVTYSELDGSPVKHSTYYRYDIHGNVAQLVQDVFGLGPKRLEYDYDLISGNVLEVRYQPNEPDQFIHRYQYDADNRIITVRTSRDGRVWDADADYYYYRHGPLARTALGQNRVQGLDYAYTLHGWIKGVNSGALNENVDIGRDGVPGPSLYKTAKDAFGYVLRYYTDDYKPIAPPALGWEPAYAGTPFHRPQRDLFNGNIQSMITAIGNPAGANTNFKPLGYAYTYDQLNRITSMQAYDGLNAKLNNWNTVVSAAYATAYSYDANGNLKTLSRRGVAATGTPLDMDDFKYRYYPGRNRLEYVDDAVPAGNYPNDIDDQNPGNYRYDAIGNLTEDQSENLRIHWNVAGKVKYIQKTAAAERIDFSYDPTGKRVIKKITNTATKKETYTYYVLDATGNVMATYTNEETPPLKSRNHRLQSLYLYGSSRLGEERIDTFLTALKNMQNRQNDTWYSHRSRGAKYFELGNHLGNVLATVSDRKLPYDLGSDGKVDGYDADIWTAQDYYPFGSGMPGREFSEGGYRYGFNGQEIDSQMYVDKSILAFMHRFLDVRVSRFLSVDPLIDDFPFYSPYHFCSNSPILAYDIEGLESSNNVNKSEISFSANLKLTVMKPTWNSDSWKNVDISFGVSIGLKINDMQTSFGVRSGNISDTYITGAIAIPYSYQISVDDNIKVAGNIGQIGSTNFISTYNPLQDLNNINYQDKGTTGLALDVNLTNKANLAVKIVDKNIVLDEKGSNVKNIATGKIGSNLFDINILPKHQGRSSYIISNHNRNIDKVLKDRNELYKSINSNKQSDLFKKYSNKLNDQKFINFYGQFVPTKKNENLPSWLDSGLKKFGKDLIKNIPKK